MITIKDVAHEAQVSIATISRVLNNSAPVATETRKKVLKIIQKMGYKSVPSPKVLGLLHTIGVVVPNLMGNHYGEIIMGMEEYAFENGFELMLSMSRSTPEKEEEVFNDYFRRKVDGILACTLMSEENSLLKALQMGIPIVLVDHSQGEPRNDSVNIDNFSAAYSVANFLYRSGHTRVFFIRGLEKVYAARDREKGFMRFREKHPDFFFQTSDIRGFDPIHGYQAMKEVLQKGTPSFSAAFCINDHVAMGAMRALSEAGLRIPEDISIIGFDDSVLAASLFPSLTTVSQPRIEMGRIAAQLLIEKLHSSRPRVARNVILPAELVIRESVKDVLSDKNHVAADIR